MKRPPKVPGMRKPTNWRKLTFRASDEVLERLALSPDLVVREAARDELTKRYLIRNGLV